MNTNTNLSDEQIAQMRMEMKVGRIVQESKILCIVGRIVVSAILLGGAMLAVRLLG